MVKYYNFDVVFAEIPDETTLAINITNCPHRCPGCHSPHLRENIGRELSGDELRALLNVYGRTVTCVCFMGGDASPMELARLSNAAKAYQPHLKTAWYSGSDFLPEELNVTTYDYIKVGAWRQEFGPLSSPKTNQKLYRISQDGSMEDITYKFWKK